MTLPPRCPRVARTESLTGHALACLYAADRYHHLETEIRPLVERGETVISDRYVPSGLVMQRFDGIDPAFLWQLNSEADRPDLAVILEADPEIIAERLAARGPHNRFQVTPGSSHAEAHFYRQATERLVQAGFDAPLVRVKSALSARGPVAVQHVVLGGLATSCGLDHQLTLYLPPVARERLRAAARQLDPSVRELITVTQTTVDGALLAHRM